MLGDFGVLTADPAVLISGSASLVGKNTDPGTQYNHYLKMGPPRFRFNKDDRYTVTFKYRIVSTADDYPQGFEILMFSPSAMKENIWVKSLVVTGPPGMLGSAKFTFDLNGFSDYELVWNVISTGEIVIDDIEVFDRDMNLIASESFEIPTLNVAQAFLPSARVGQMYACSPAVAGDTGNLIRVVRAEGTLPKGLQVDPEGNIEGVPQQEGEYTLSLVFTDADGRLSRLSYGLTVVPEGHVSDYVVVGVENTDLNEVQYTYEPYTKAFRNPLKGMRPYAESARMHPWATLGRQYIAWNLIERNALDTVERIRDVTDKLVGDLPSYNIKIIPRVYLHWPPDRNYWPEDLKVGDYYSKQFEDRVLNLINKLGQAWDDDPRIAFIEMGIVGQWGEQHDPSFGNFEFDEPVRPVSFERSFAEAFEKSFPNKLVMYRYPRDFTGYPFGIYWDVFGAIGNGFWGNDAIGMAEELKKPERRDLWKTTPRGGEIDPTFLGYPSWDIGYFNTMVKEKSEYLVDIIKDLHWNHLAVLEYVDIDDEVLWEKGSAIQNALGYAITIEEAVISAQIWRSRLSIALTLNNTGSSPIYYNWPLQIALLDSMTRQPVWAGQWPNLDIRTWLPQETCSIKQSFTIPSLPDGEYIVAVSILDPSGMVPSIRFANENYYNGGYTPVGVTGVGCKPTEFIINGFDDLSADRSLYYVP